MSADLDREIGRVLFVDMVDREGGDTDRWVWRQAVNKGRQENRRRREARDVLRRLDPARAMFCDAIDPIVDPEHDR